MRGVVVCRRCGRTSASCPCIGERSFAVKVFLGKDSTTGKERQKWIGGFRSEREAKAHLLQIAASPAYGSGLGPFGSMRVRLGDYLREWLQAVRQSICEKEYHARLARSTRHIIPQLGHVPLARLAPATLQRFFSVELAAMHPTTAHKVFKDLRQALDHAVKLGLITNNPARMIEAPRPRPYRPTLFTPDELARFVAACAQAGARGLLFVTAFASGTRQGELLGAQWRYTDLEGGVVWIIQDLERPRGGGFRFGEVKSKHGKRPIRLPRSLLEELRVLRTHQRAERLRRAPCEAGAACRQQHCPCWHELDLVFCQPNGKPLHGDNLTRRDLKALCTRAKVPAIRMHDLRHLHNTTLMREGVNPKIVKERAGHASVAFTLEKYSWVTPDLQEVAVEALSRSLARTPEPLPENTATGMLPDPAAAGSQAGGPA
jgi:integrase